MLFINNDITTATEIIFGKYFIILDMVCFVGRSDHILFALIVFVK